MPLGGRPEPGWIAIGSHAAQRAPGLTGLIEKTFMLYAPEINSARISINVHKGFDISGTDPTSFDTKQCF